MRYLFILIISFTTCFGLFADSPAPQTANLAIVWTGKNAGVSARIGFTEAEPEGFLQPAKIDGDLQLTLSREGNNLIGSVSFFVFWQILGNQTFQLLLEGPEGMQLSGQEPIDYEVSLSNGNTVIIDTEEKNLQYEFGYITESVSDYEKLDFKVVLDDQDIYYTSSPYTADLKLTLKVVS